MTNEEYISAQGLVPEHFTGEDEKKLETQRKKESQENVNNIIAECHGDSLLKVRLTNNTEV